MDPADPVVAKVADVSIFASDVRAQAAKTGASSRDALEDLIAVELLATAARDRDRSRAIDLEMYNTWKSALVERFLERELETRLSPQHVPDSYLRPFYDRAIDGFVHPRLVEIGVLSVYTGERMKPEARARRTQTARALAAFVAAAPPGTVSDFEAIAADPRWRDQKVVFTRTWQSGDRPFPEAVGRRAIALRKPGETTAQVEDESGFHIARYAAERPPKNVPFSEARAEILAEVYQRWKADEFLRLGHELSTRHKIKVFPERLVAETPPRR